MGRTFTDSTNVLTTASFDVGASARTWSTWVRRTGSGGGNFGRIWVKSDEMQLFYSSGDSKYKYQSTNDDRQGLFPETSTTWAHICVVDDLADSGVSPKFYVDGVLKSVIVNDPGCS